MGSHSVARLGGFVPKWAVLNLNLWVKIGLGGWKKFGMVWDQFGVFLIVNKQNGMLMF